MRSLLIAFLVCAAASFSTTQRPIATTVANAAITPSRVHLVDSFEVEGGRSYFFRGNSPYVDHLKSVEYETWLQTISNVLNATTAQQLPPNEKVWLVDLSLENMFDKGFFAEKSFFEENPKRGAFLGWELLGAPLWPSAFDAAQVEEMIATNSVWKHDQLPARMDMLKSLLQQPVPNGYDATVYYAHCAAGCDRTGEFIAAYRMSKTLANNPNINASSAIAPIFEQNCQECGRCPNYYSAGATGWYCMTLNHFNRSNMPPIGDCFTAFQCKPLGSCTSTGI